MPYPTIATLPDVPILNILKRLSLYDLVYGARQTSARMRSLAPIVLARRHTLVLTHGDDQDESLNSLREDKLHCGQLLQLVQREDGSPMVRLPELARYKFDFVPLPIAIRGPALMNALPRITNLTVMYNNISPVFLERVIQMLNHWSGTLFSLTFNLNGLTQFGSLNELRVIETINGLNSLRHLKICLDKFNPVLGFRHNPNLEFVSRLVTLCVDGMAFNPSWFFESLARYGPTNANLRQICYHHNCDYDSYHTNMLQFGLEHPRLANCFTSLTTGVFFRYRWSDESAQEMHRLCTRYSSLTTLQLDIEPSAMAGMAQQLRRLPHLVTLKLGIMRYQEDHFDPEDFEDGWPILVENAAPIEDGFLVHSVRVLRLSLTTESHENIGALRIASYFPNIQLLYVEQDHGNCYLCTPDATRLDQTIYGCLQDALLPFRACAQLRTIVYNPGVGRELREISPQGLVATLNG